MSDKKFTGVWLPAAVLQDNTLTWTEKILIGYTMSFPNRCFASDEHMAATLGMARKTVANMLSNLRRKGYLVGRDFPKSGERDFPKTGTGLPQDGNETSLRREHRYKVEKSEKKNNNPGANADPIPEAFKQEELVSLTANRGFPLSDVHDELAAALTEIRTGLTAPPGHWPSYLLARVTKERNRKRRESAVHAHSSTNANVSRFAVCH